MAPAAVLVAALLSLLTISAAADDEASDRELSEVEALLDALPADLSAAFEFKAADSLTHFVDGDSLVLRGNAVVFHKGAQLEAGELVYHSKEELVDARAFVDSSGRLVGAPSLTRGNDVLRGKRILYDMASGEGMIVDGVIQYKDGHYGGRYIETTSDEEFHVHAGSYTTCDRESPHFDFYSPRIKVLVGDMAIARPVYFRINERRLIPIPFYVFSLREDRQSGMLTPGFGRRPVTFGSTESEWEIRNLGYYLAASDYWDLTLSADMRQRSGWLTQLATAYAWRYRFSGRVETRVQNRQTGSSGNWEWWTRFNHSQKIGESADLRASGTFQSSKNFLRDNSLVLQERLNRTLRSNARFSKRWRQRGASLTLSSSYTKNLDTERFDFVLPEISVRSNRKALFGDGGGRSSSAPWYGRIYYDVNSRLRNTQKGSPADTTTRTSANVSLGLSSQQRPLSWLSINTSLNESWNDADLRSSQQRYEGVRSDRLRSSATLSQTLYGMFHTDVWRVTALRHVVKPDIGASYQATRSDTGGVGLDGRSSPWTQRRQLTFRLNNTLWVKLLKDEEEEKVRLAQLNLSTSYDFDRDGSPLSDLLSSLTIGAGKRLNTRVNMRSEFYDGDDVFRAHPRLRQFEINTSLRFTGHRSTGDRGRGSDSSDRSSAEISDPSTGVLQAGQSRSAYGSGEFGYEGGLQRDMTRREGRQVQISHYYSRRRGSSSRSWLRTGLGGSWRGRWHLHYSLNYTLLAQGKPFFDDDRVSAELLSVQRHFHDWSATVNIEPSRFTRDRAFYFKAQLDDIPQIRFERGDSRRR